MTEIVKLSTGELAWASEGLHSELDKIEGQIARLKANISGSVAHKSSDEKSQVTARSVLSLLKARRIREACFDESLFADPAWDILLELYAAHLDDKRISISGVCVANPVPSTTALRWMDKLESGGWIIREDDPSDGRRAWVHLSNKATAAMDQFFFSSAVWPV